MLALFLVVVVIIVLVVIAFAFMFGGSGKWTAAFQAVAQRYGGWFTPAGIFRRPAAAFTYNNSVTHLKCKKRRKFSPFPQTELKIAWPSERFKLEIIRDHGTSRIRSFREEPVADINDEEFCNDFLVLCQDVERAKQILSSGAKWQLQQLRHLPINDSLYVGFDRGSLTIAKKSYIKDKQMLEDFVRLGLEFFDQAILTLSEGIDFPSGENANVIEESKCPVCSCDLTNQLAICVRCKTPHCLECWQYNGQCAMFACGETRYSVGGL